LHGVEAHPSTGSDHYDRLSNAETCPLGEGVVRGHYRTGCDGRLVERHGVRNLDEEALGYEYVLAVATDRAEPVAEGKILTKRCPPADAEAATAAGDVSVGDSPVTDRGLLDIGTDTFDLTRDLMTERHGQRHVWHQAIPDLDVGVTHSGSSHPEKNLVATGDGPGNLGELRLAPEL
jgi:hypothetical protein